jgi:hypothetical protein
VFLTSGESDLLVIMETANGDNIAKFALMSGADCNVRSRTVRAWPEAETVKLISRAHVRRRVRPRPLVRLDNATVAHRKVRSGIG